MGGIRDHSPKVVGMVSQSNELWTVSDFAQGNSFFVGGAQPLFRGLSFFLGPPKVAVSVNTSAVQLKGKSREPCLFLSNLYHPAKNTYAEAVSMETSDLINLKASWDTRRTQPAAYNGRPSQRLFRRSGSLPVRASGDSFLAQHRNGVSFPGNCASIVEETVFS